MSRLLAFASGLTVVLVLAAVIGVGAGTGAASSPDASRIVDRTISCATGLSGGIREVDIRANSAYGSGSDRRHGYVHVGTSVMPTWQLGGISQGEVSMSPSCTPVRARVPLTARGLVGGTVAQIGESVDCATPRRILLRVHAIFRSPVTLKRGQLYRFPLLFARGAVVEGTLAVRTPSGKSLAFARVLESGKVQVFAAIPEGCIPD